MKCNRQQPVVVIIYDGNRMGKRVDIDREGAKWLNLAFETYGCDGVNEMARTLGFPAMRPSPRKRVGLPEPKGGDGDDAWREPVRMPAMCPARKPIGDSRWKPY